jgi:hypothetical protein
LLDVREGPAVFMVVVVTRFTILTMIVAWFMPVSAMLMVVMFVAVRVPVMLVGVLVFVFVPMSRFAGVSVPGLVMRLVEIDIKLRPRDVRPLLARRVQFVTLQAQLLQFVLQRVEIHAQVNHRAEEHVAAQSAENIEVKSLHPESGSSTEARTC